MLKLTTLASPVRTLALRTRFRMLTLTVRQLHPPDRARAGAAASAGSLSVSGGASSCEKTGPVSGSAERTGDHPSQGPRIRASNGSTAAPEARGLRIEEGQS